MLILVKKISISGVFDAQKLDALQMYAEQKNIDFKAELAKFLEKKYQRIVPKQVQEYIAIAGSAGLPPDSKKHKSEKRIPDSEENVPLSDSDAVESTSQSFKEKQDISANFSSKTDVNQGFTNNSSPYSW